MREGDGACAPIAFPHNCTNRPPPPHRSPRSHAHTTLQKVDLATLSRQMMVEELLEFVDVAARSTKKESEMAKFFFKYLIEKISSRMDDEGLSIGLRAMIRREKRAVADYFDFVNECQSLLKTPRIAQVQ